MRNETIETFDQMYIEVQSGDLIMLGVYDREMAQDEVSKEKVFVWNLGFVLVGIGALVFSVLTRGWYQD